MYEPEHFLPAQNRLGETPIWAPEEKAFYWVDWGGRPTCRFELATGKFTTFKVNLPVTALARRTSGEWIAVAQSGLFEWDPSTNGYSQLVGPPEPGNLDISYNDCAVDRQGRLLVGTVNMQDPFAPEGSLYRLDADGTLHMLDTGYATANGIGVSPDGRTVYVTDMRHNQIIVVDYDTSQGTVSNRRLFARVPAEDGMPDGLIVDADGFVWSGHWAGWRLTRYDPDGKIERQVRFPVQHVISFAFGGKDLDELFVTTAWWGFSDEERKGQPQAGDIFRVETGVKGLVEPAFAG
ncbi:MAG TPA: SMP-30/gluconolactonase/LRE family protein [Anaerolineae bacterium]|jgi:sugar lactone lactonase YvrE|nr:SMP-30/gluconolactonase/LRE family protein [Anaerolineae bacterium]